MPSACSVPSGPAGLPDTDDPASHAEMADSLSLAFLVLLETVSPEQRAAFLLREVFDYPYDQIAAIVTTSEQNARQLVARARRHVQQRRPRFEPSREQRERLARLLAGEQAVVMMTEGRGFSNAKAKWELGWEPRYPLWRQGFKVVRCRGSPPPPVRLAESGGRRREKVRVARG